MPNVRRIKRYRFFFSSCDGTERPHIHVEHEGRVAKFWLDPVTQAKSGRLPDHELREIERLVIEHRLEFIEAWNDYFGN